MSRYPTPWRNAAIGFGPTVTTGQIRKVTWVDPVQPFASVAMNVTVYEPALPASGIPERTPARLKVRPEGSVPAEDQAMPPTPPDCVNVTGVIADPSTPLIGPLAPTVIVGHWIVRVTARSPKQELASVARMVIGKDPVCSGVPERTPVPGSSDMPLGRAPVTDQVIAPTPPVCVKAAPG